MENLDDTAFKFFSIVVLLLYILGAGGWLLWKLYQNKTQKVVYRTNVERENAEKFNDGGSTPGSGKSKWFRNVSFAVVLNVILILLSLYTIVTLVEQLKISAEVRGFDPFAVLELEPGAEQRQIKSAYRKLSLKYHPDKPEGDEEKFLTISKAYKILTDETAKENFEKYGNPDGPEPMKFGIGLPSFFADESKQRSIVFLYIALLAIGVPLLVKFWKTDSAAEPTPESAALAYQNLDGETARLSSIQDLFICARELGDLLFDEEADAPWLDALMKEIKLAKKPKQYSWYVRDENGNLRPLQLPFDTVAMYQALLTNYLSGDKYDFGCLTAAQKAQAIEKLVFMLNNTPRILKSFMEGCKPMNQDGSGSKPIAFLRIVEFSQVMCQAMPITDADSLNTLKQIPGFSHELVTKKLVKLPQIQRNFRLLDFLRLPHEQVIDEIISRFPEEDEVRNRREEILRLLASLPDLKVQASLDVEGASEVHPNDIVLLRVKLEHRNCVDLSRIASIGQQQVLGSSEDRKDGEPEYTNNGSAYVDLEDSDVSEEKKLYWPTSENLKSSEDESTPVPQAHTPYFPQPVKERWYLVLLQNSWEGKSKKSKTLKKHLRGIDYVDESTKVIRKNMRLPAPPTTGEYEFELHVKSNCYVGLDHKVTLKLNVVEPSEPEETQKEEVQNAEGEEEEEEEDDGEEFTSLEHLLGGQAKEIKDDSDDEEEEQGGEAAPEEEQQQQQQEQRTLTKRERKKLKGREHKKKNKKAAQDSTGQQGQGAEDNKEGQSEDEGAK
eukprot:gb/GECG01008270.1/.p1 GENE.gb/GECG01008270.1/~~gb/GECG01008270.1/.p1  ORF type:complete len:779 (+),score=148.41 gb/GECG01008270.1/:1-2337(+)